MSDTTLSARSIRQFKAAIAPYYGPRQRAMPWRQAESNGRFDAYKILVSEFMLQQTQVQRVIPKYEAFLKTFPDLATLSQATLPDVLRLWSGLGYNRRAQYIWRTAQQLEHVVQPWSLSTLTVCPGIGHNTASAIRVYTYNQPDLFIETNIRAVLLHHFFPDQEAVSDKEILSVLSMIIDTHNPHIFYWALMDYGTALKAHIGNPNRRSASYSKQTSFNGSVRQVRGRIIRALLNGPQSIQELKATIADKRFDAITEQLIHEQLVSLQDETLMLYNEHKD